MEMQLYERMSEQNAMQAVEKLGDFFAKSGMLGVQTPAQGAVLAMTCMCERISPLEFQRTYHIVEGRPSMRADAMLAEFQKRGGKVKWHRWDGEAAEATFIYDGNECRMSFTIEEARNAGLIRPRSAWEKQPAAMLRARLTSAAIRMLCPGVNAGLYAPEEMDVREVEARPVADQPSSFLASAPAPTPVPVVAASDEDEVVDQFAAAIVEAGPQFQLKAAAYCAKIGWLPEGGKLLSLEPHRKAEILARWDSFRAKVEGSK